MQGINWDLRYRRTRNIQLLHIDTTDYYWPWDSLCMQFKKHIYSQGSGGSPVCLALQTSKGVRRGTDRLEVYSNEVTQRQLFLFGPGCFALVSQTCVFPVAFTSVDSPPARTIRISSTEVDWNMYKSFQTKVFLSKRTAACCSLLQLIMHVRGAMIGVFHTTLSDPFACCASECANQHWNSRVAAFKQVLWLLM